MGIQKIQKHFLLLVRLNVHKIIISYCAHIRLIQEMAMKTSNIQYENSSKVQNTKLCFQQTLMFINVFEHDRGIQKIQTFNLASNVT